MPRSRASRSHRHVRAPEIEQQAHLPREQVGRDLEDKKRRNFTETRFSPRILHRFDLRQATQPDPEIDAHAVGVELSALGVQPSIGISFYGRGDPEMGEASEFLNVFTIEDLRHGGSLLAEGPQRLGQNRARIEVSHLARDLGRAIRRIESRDRTDA